jgi:hypothetical protein
MDGIEQSGEKAKVFELIMCLGSGGGIAKLAPCGIIHRVMDYGHTGVKKVLWNVKLVQ